jgi:hypothetical protein
MHKRWYAVWYEAAGRLAGDEVWSANDAKGHEKRETRTARRSGEAWIANDAKGHENHETRTARRSGEAWIANDAKGREPPRNANCAKEREGSQATKFGARTTRKATKTTKRELREGAGRLGGAAGPFEKIKILLP